jgi:hypothetical protein
MYAVSKPSTAVTGAAIADSLTVVQNELHAVPTHSRPLAPDSTPKALM